MTRSMWVGDELTLWETQISASLCYPKGACRGSCLLISENCCSQPAADGVFDKCVCEGSERNEGGREAYLRMQFYFRGSHSWECIVMPNLRLNEREGRLSSL